MRHRLVLQTWSIQGWYMPNVTQLKKMTAMLILSNHVSNFQELKENIAIAIFLFCFCYFIFFKTIAMYFI